MDICIDVFLRVCPQTSANSVLGRRRRYFALKTNCVLCVTGEVVFFVYMLIINDVKMNMDKEKIKSPLLVQF